MDSEKKHGRRSPSHLGCEWVGAHLFWTVRNSIPDHLRRQDIVGRAPKNKTVMQILEVEKGRGGLSDRIPVIGGNNGRGAWVRGDAKSAPM